MGMRVMKKDMDAAENLLNASIEYLYGDDTDGTGLEAAQYEVKGAIQVMPSDSLKYYHEYLEWDAMDADSQELFLSYYLQVNKVADTDLGRSRYLRDPDSDLFGDWNFPAGQSPQRPETYQGIYC